jgi:hypothetical protein
LREHLATLSRLEAFTFAAWVRNPRKDLAIVFSLSGDSERQRVQLFLTDRQVRFGWQDGLHFDLVTGVNDGWEADRWYHVAVTVEEAVARLYQDGQLIGAGSVGSWIGTPVGRPAKVKQPTHVYIGRLEDGSQGGRAGHQWYEGEMDDVQIYRGALDREAVRFLHENPGISWQSQPKAQPLNAKL